MRRHRGIRPAAGGGEGDGAGRELKPRRPKLLREGAPPDLCQRAMTLSPSPDLIRVLYRSLLRSVLRTERGARPEQWAVISHCQRALVKRHCEGKVSTDMAEALNQRLPPSQLVQRAFRVESGAMGDVDFAFRALRCSGQIATWLEENNALHASMRGLSAREAPAQPPASFVAEQMILKRV